MPPMPPGAMSVAPAGDLDLFIGQQVGNELWYNNGLGKFAPAGGVPTGGSLTAKAAAWIDADNDGDMPSNGLSSRALLHCARSAAEH